MGFGEWFTEIALDGIAGGLIGGGIAAWALRRTIKHERGLRIEDQKEQQLEALRRHVAEMLEVATGLVHDAAIHGSDLRAAVSRASVPIVLVESLALRRNKLLALECRRIRTGLVAAVDPSVTVDRAEVQRLSDELQTIASKWLFETPPADEDAGPLEW